MSDPRAGRAYSVLQVGGLQFDRRAGATSGLLSVGANGISSITRNVAVDSLSVGGAMTVAGTLVAPVGIQTGGLLLSGSDGTTGLLRVAAIRREDVRDPGPLGRGGGRLGGEGIHN